MVLDCLNERVTVGSVAGGYLFTVCVEVPRCSDSASLITIRINKLNGSVGLQRCNMPGRNSFVETILGSGVTVVNYLRRGSPGMC